MGRHDPLNKTIRQAKKGIRSCQMKSILLAAGILGASLLASRPSHATPGWVQLPGLATQIAVGANDIPFIVDLNGFLQYLAPPVVDCESGSGLCVEQPRSWVMYGSTNANTLATDQLGYPWWTDANDVLHVGFNNSTAFGVAAQTISSGCVSSIAPGRRTWPAEFNYPFGVASGSVTVTPNSPIIIPFKTTYTTPCDGLRLTGNDFTYQISAPFVTSFTSSGWTQIDTGEMQVAQFTVDGSADQVPWVQVTSSGNRVAYAYNSSTRRFIGAGAPQVAGLRFQVDYLTDHYIAANYGSHSEAFRWTGTAFATGGGWTPVINSDQIPDGGYIVQLAYASALPGVSIDTSSGRTTGTIGPSHLYMIDSNNNIYQYGDVQQPPR